jgi:hypothetical protein
VSFAIRLLGRFINPLKLVPLALRAAGNGTFGPKVRVAYHWLAGKKGWIAAALTAWGAFIVQLRVEDPAACEAIGCDSLEAILAKWGPIALAWLAAAYVSATDEAVRMYPPAAPPRGPERRVATEDRRETPDVD